MNRKVLFGVIAALSIASTGTYALAQTSPPPPPPAANASRAGAGMPMQRMYHQRGMKTGMQRQGKRGHGMRNRSFGPDGAVIADLRHLSRLYMMQGKSRELPALYKHVLASTRNQKVRNFVYNQLAREQMRPTNVDAAIATLRTSLDENLTLLNKREALRKERIERMKGK